jgi:hypothetical protein
LLKNKTRGSKLLIIFYPYKVTEFIWKLMEIDEFNKYFNVIIFDFSLFLDPIFSQKTVGKRIVKDNVVCEESISDLIKNIRNLISLSTDKEIYLINQIPRDSYREFLAHLLFFVFFRNKFIANIETFIGGIPLTRDHRGKTINTYGEAGSLVVLTRVFIKLINRIRVSIPLLLNKTTPSMITHVFYAGEDWLALAKSMHGEKVVYIPGSSNNYSQSILVNKNSEPNPKKKIAVLLDAPSPKYSTDAIKLRRKMYLTVGDWYPKLASFFDALEGATGTIIEIAGHPMSNFPTKGPLFGRRRVAYNQTIEMVKGCSFVITRSSTAISFAVIYNKPVIFIYSNQLKKDKFAMSNIFSKAAMLGATPVNIDSALPNISELLFINKERRLSYKSRCLTSENLGRPNYRVIMEDIMGINGNCSKK